MRTSEVLLFCAVVFLSVIVSTSGKFEGDSDILGQNNLSVCTKIDRNTLTVSENKSLYGQKNINFYCVQTYSFLRQASENSNPPIKIYADCAQTRFN